MKAGKHSYFVKGIESEEFFAHKFIAPFRDEEIPICNISLSNLL
jgi:hypothetical protein